MLNITGNKFAIKKGTKPTNLKMIIINNSFLLKILLGLFYLSILISFLFILFSNFDLGETSTYEFIQKNKDQLDLLKQNKLIFFS